MTSREGRCGRFLVSILALCAVAAGAQEGELQVEIQNVPAETLLTGGETSTEIAGMASVFGGLKHLDMFLVLDTSSSLRRTDPQNYRTGAAVNLVQNLSRKSDIHIGLVEFDTSATLVSPLGSDRDTVVSGIEALDVAGGTNLAEGILTAVGGFERNARPGSSRVILLFTDGVSDADEAIAAAKTARDAGLVVHALLLGARDRGAELLKRVADTTGGTFVLVENPEDLPDAFRNLRTTGVDHVKLTVDGSAPIDTELWGGSFHGEVPLRPGRNVVTATATSLAGETRSHSVTVTVTGPLRVAIAEPVDGRVFRERETETEVAVEASVFTEMTPELAVDFPTAGVGSVVLRANDSAPIPAEWKDGRFVARVPLSLHDNRIAATATSVDGRVAETFVNVTVRPPGCADLRVRAERDGRPAISLDDRGLEVIFDASNSMWGRIDGKPKITIAKEVLREVIDTVPEDLQLALRVYGHRHPVKARRCEDSELLVPLGVGNRPAIREAVEKFQPKGQTPLAYSIARVPEDFGDFRGDRAVVLVTDGIESCEGDPEGAARGIQAEGERSPVHVIGFALAGEEEALESLRAISASSGGRFVTADSADELREALAATVGTPFTIWRGTARVGEGVLGVDAAVKLPEGGYGIRLESEPPRTFSVDLRAEEALSATLVREGDEFSTREDRSPIEYVPCDAFEVVASEAKPAVTADGWERAPRDLAVETETPAGESSFGNDDVIDLTRAGLSSAIIIRAIDAAENAAFDVSPQGLIDLSAAGVSPEVIEHIQARSRNDDGD